MGKPSEKKHTHRDSTGSVMPSGEGLRVLTAAVYRGRLPGLSCLAACTTFAKPPEQRHSGDGPYPCCPRPNSALVSHRRMRKRVPSSSLGSSTSQVVPPPAKEGGSERAAPTASGALSSIWLPRPWPGGRVITSIRATYIVLQASDHACRILSLLQYRRKCIVSSFPLSHRGHTPRSEDRKPRSLSHTRVPQRDAR